MKYLILFICCSLPLYAQGPTWEPDQLIVRTRVGVTGAELLHKLQNTAHTKARRQPLYRAIRPLFPTPPQRRQKARIRYHEPTFTNPDIFPERHCYQVLSLTRNADVAEVARRLSEHEDVLWAEPDYHIQLANSPARPGGRNWHLEYLRVPEAWALGSAGISNMVIAIIDSGVDAMHPDLDSQQWRNTWETQNGLDDDGNGYVDDHHGWDFVNQEVGQDLLIRPLGANFMVDTIGHGTHCAGIAVANNGLGVAPGCRFMSLKAFDDSGVAQLSTILPAINYAVRNGADILSMSFSLDKDSPSLEEALEAASQTCLLVAAAGNHSLSLDRRASYPAAYPFVLGVEALSCYRENGNLLPAVFSNRGYDLAVPGVHIESTLPGAVYGFKSGTSMATPIVAGVGALIWSQSPTLTPGQVFNRLLQFQSDAFQGISSPPATKFKVVDVTVEDTCASPCTDDDRASPGETVKVTIHLLNQGDPAQNVTASLDGQILQFGNIGANEVGLASKNYQVVPGGSLGTLSMNGMLDTDIAIPIVEYLPSNMTIDTTLDSDIIHILSDELVVAQGIQLTIPAGTRLEIATPHAIIVNGNIFASGTAAEPIHFQVDPEVDWAGLDLGNSPPPLFSSGGAYLSGNVLQYCVFDSGSDDITQPVGKAVSGPVYLSHNVFRGFDTAVDCTVNSAVGIESNLFEFNKVAIMGFTLAQELIGSNPTCPSSNDPTVCDTGCTGYNYIRYNSFIKSINASIVSDGVAQLGSHRPAIIYRNNFLKDKSIARHLTPTELVLEPGTSVCLIGHNYWGDKGLNRKIAGSPIDNLTYEGAPPEEATPVVANIEISPALTISAPPQVRQLGTITVAVLFSREMDTTQMPTLQLGREAPFNERTSKTGSWNAVGDSFTTSVEMDHCQRDGDYTVIVSNAYDKYGFPVPSLDCRFQFQFGGLSGTAPEAVANNGRICLEWDDLVDPCISGNCASAMAYNVYRKKASDSTPPEILNNRPIFGTSYEDTEVLAGQQYIYLVRAINSDLSEGAASMAITITVPLETP